MWLTVAVGVIKTAALAWVLVRGIRSTMRWTDRTYLLVTCGAAMAVSMVWVALVRPEPAGDAEWYHLRAMTLAAGGGFAIDGRPTSLFPPVYPLLLASFYRLFGASLWWGRLLNIGFIVGAVLLVWRIGRDLFGPEVGRLSAAIVALWPGRIPYSALLLSEPFFVCAFLAAFALWLRAARSQRYIVAAILTGGCSVIAGLTRPVAMPYLALLPLVCVLAGGSVHRALRATLLAGAVVVVVLAPWAWRNYQAFGAFVPLTTSTGIVMRDGNHVGATGLPSDANDNPHRSIRDEIARDRSARQEAAQFVRDHPREAFRLYWVRLYRTYEFDTETAVSPTVESSLGAPLQAMYLRICTTYFNSMMLAFVGFLLLPFVAPVARTLWRSASLVVVPVAFLALFQAVFLAQYRYNYPVEPFIAIGAAACFQWMSSMAAAIPAAPVACPAATR